MGTGEFFRGGATLEVLVMQIRLRASALADGDVPLAAAQVAALVAGADEAGAVTGGTAVVVDGVEAGEAAGLSPLQAGLAMLAFTAALSVGCNAQDDIQARAAARLIASFGDVS